MRINIVIQLLLIVLLTMGCKKKEQVEVADVPVLKLLFTTPADQSTDVALEEEIALVFNTVPAVLTKEAITVNGKVVETEITDRKVKLKLPLSVGTKYQVRLAKGALENKANVESETDFSFSFETVSDTKRYEAENAGLSGNAVVESSKSGYSGQGYVNQKDGDVSFNVTLPKDGLYQLKIRYTNDNQKKENDLWVNGVKIGTLAFAATADWQTLDINKIALKAGVNSLVIKKNWGWAFYDYFDIQPNPADKPFQLDASLTNANASPAAKNVYAFLKENFGKKVISGAMANYSTGLEEAQWLFDNTGKWPALAGFDFINYTRDWKETDFKALVNNAKLYWQQNGLVSIMWHWRDPSKVTDGFYTKDTNFDITKISNVNSDEYKAVIRDIDQIATYLKELQDAGVPVIWRPLHEASGKWFWWGAKGAEPCQVLWKLLYERLTHVHHLDNLIWVWTTDAATDAASWYPGDQYVDILGMDIYAGENQHGSQYLAFDQVKSIFSGKKLIALSECGSVPDIDAMFEMGDVWSWFMPWNGDYTRSDTYNGKNYFVKLFQHDKVITRDKMSSLK